MVQNAWYSPPKNTSEKSVYCVRYLSGHTDSNLPSPAVDLQLAGYTPKQ